MFSFFSKKFEVYTDGSHKNGWGSWAFVVLKRNKVVYEESGREKRAGSNRMEFQAALKALNYLPDKSSVQIYTDSRILINAIHEEKKTSGHEDQIIEIQNLCLKKNVKWSWVKAHSGVRHNERCDELCIQARG